MPIEKWDILVLTANNLAQRNLIQNRLLPEFCEYFLDSLVIEDWPPDFKIGSGGATINALIKLHEIYGDEFYKKRILILHSGGFSQRLPHASAIGKLFMNLSGGKCLLDIKLNAYLNLLSKIPPGKFAIFLAASDTFECFDALYHLKIDLNVDIVLFGHDSDESTATRHGVYILDSNDGDLEKVWQKPSIEKLSTLNNFDDVGKNSESNGKNSAVISQKRYLTDSCYLFQSSEIVKNLIETRKKYGIIASELCAYGDFLQGLGKMPEPLMPSAKDFELAKWQKIVREIFYGKTTQLANLGKNSFFHFGTNLEFLVNILPSSNSYFFQNFLPSTLESAQNIIASTLPENWQNNDKIFVEYSEIGKNCILEENCIMSRVYCKNIDSKNAIITIPKNSLLIGFYLTNKDDVIQHVTVLFPIDCDFKASSTKILKWFQHEIQIEQEKDEQSLWTIPIFPIRNCPYESFRDTIKMLEMGPEFKGHQNFERISLWDAIQKVDLKRLEWYKNGKKA